MEMELGLEIMLALAGLTLLAIAKVIETLHPEVKDVEIED